MNCTICANIKDFVPTVNLPKIPVPKFTTANVAKVLMTVSLPIFFVGQPLFGFSVFWLGTIIGLRLHELWR